MRVFVSQVVSLLLCQGADPNARDNWNYTPLHEAAIKGKIDVCIGGEGGANGSLLLAPSFRANANSLT